MNVEVAVLVEHHAQLPLKSLYCCFFPRGLDVVMAHVGRVADTSVVVRAAMTKNATVNEAAVFRRNPGSHASPVNFNTNVILEVPPDRKTTVARPHVEH